MLHGRRVHDCFPFFNEADILEVRLRELSGIVDRFVLVEATRTHSGKTKPLYFRENKARFSEFLDRIEHIVVDDFPPADMAQLGQSWIYERHQRDAIARGLKDAKDEDIVITSDVDEIPRAEALERYDPAAGFVGLDLSLHTYWLNMANRETEYAWCKVLPYGLARQMTHCQIRYTFGHPVIKGGGWHFSFMGGPKEVREKIQAWAHCEYDIPRCKDEKAILGRMAEGVDPHERALRYRIEPLDGSYPKFVLENRAKFKHLIQDAGERKPAADQAPKDCPRTVGWNARVWEEYAWPKDGDEWTEMADFSRVPYERWRESLARTFLIPHLLPQSAVVEIGPGHGRWSKLIHQRVEKGVVHLVDISQECLDFCQRRFLSYHFIFHKGDGRTMPGVESGSIDFIWSFDTFVHIEEPEVRSYAGEFMRALKPRGMGVVHHPGNPTIEQRHRGCRSMMTSDKWRNILVENGLFVIRQTDAWDGGNVKLNNDILTVFVKP